MSGFDSIKTQDTDNLFCCYQIGAWVFEFRNKLAAASEPRKLYEIPSDTSKPWRIQVIDNDQSETSNIEKENSEQYKNLR